MQKSLRWYDGIFINSYYLGLTVRSQTLAPLILPLLVQQFVGEAQKGTYFGTYRLWTLMVALLAQALFGLLSDRSRLRWGRRRPFIFTGTLLDMVFIVLIGFTAGMEGLNGFWIMFGVAMLLQVSSNMAHAATQGVIPDLVPEHQRGRASGVKSVLELLPVWLVPTITASPPVSPSVTT